MKRRGDVRYNPKNLFEVLDRNTNLRIGYLANLSKKGAMIITSSPVQTSTILKCKITLHTPIMDHNEIILDAVCCWCRKNIKTDSWESGYKLELSGVDKELISYLCLSFIMNRLEYPGIEEYNTIELDNRRNNTRYRSKNQFPVLEKQNSSPIGEVVDLSQGGIKIISDKQHKKNEIVEYRAKLPKRIFQRDYLIFKAECMWCKKLEKTGKFVSGFKFIMLPQQDSVIILHLMIHHLEEIPSTQRIKIIQ